MIPHNKPTLGKQEEEAALRVIRSGQLAQDKEVELFENEFCEFMNLPHGHAVALSSGTASLFLSLWILKAQEKKQISPKSGMINRKRLTLKCSEVFWIHICGMYKRL